MECNQVVFVATFGFNTQIYPGRCISKILQVYPAISDSNGYPVLKIEGTWMSQEGRIKG